MTVTDIGWNTQKEKLLCLMVLDDEIAQKMMPGAASAFWRGFIVQDRQTGTIFAKFRFRYKDHSNWAEIVPPVQDENTMKDLRFKLELTVRLASDIFSTANGVVIDIDKVIVCFYPPDDGGDPVKTVAWLEMRDLIKITRVESA